MAFKNTPYVMSLYYTIIISQYTAIKTIQETSKRNKKLHFCKFLYVYVLKWRALYIYYDQSITL